MQALQKDVQGNKAKGPSSQTIDRKEAEDLRRVLQILDQFGEYSQTMPIQIARAFVVTALNEGKSLRELTELSDQRLSTMSRHMLDLQEPNRSKGEGYKLVEARTSPDELRKKEYRLSKRGRMLKDRLVNIVRGGTSTDPQQQR